MTLEYYDRTKVCGALRTRARVTTEHAASSYGQPVVVLPSGAVLDYLSWVTLSYRVVRIGKTEAALMDKWLRNLHMMVGGGSEVGKGGAL